MTTLTELECALCGSRYDASGSQSLCRCGGALWARYDLERARRGWSRDWIKNGPATIWRYAPVLPVSQPGPIVSLGEGMTPLIRASRLGERLGVRQLWIKDEGLNPTGSVKARDMACAVSRLRELGRDKVAVASAGNAAAALAAYAASAGLEAHVFLPRRRSPVAYLECRAAGARVSSVSGGLEDCARRLAEANRSGEWFDVSAWREPYRLEGRKTLAYELAEDFNWSAPDVILCPAGEGIGVAALAKGFEEIQALGWLVGPPPRLIAVEAEGRAPMTRALRSQPDSATLGRTPSLVAVELGGTTASPDAWVLETLRRFGGTACAAGDQEILEAGLELAALEGILPAPEGAAAIAVLRKLLSEGFLDAGRRIVLVNPGSGWKRWQAYAARLRDAETEEADKLGGLITPR